MWSSCSRRLLLCRGLFGQTRLDRLATRLSSSSSVSPSVSSDPLRPSPSPLDHPDFFGVHKLFTVEDLFHARVHLGHTPRALNPKMRPFVIGNRFDSSVVDLDQTASLLRRALNFLAHLSAQGGIVLFVSRQPHLTHLVERAAVDCGEYAHCRAWDTSILTDPVRVFQQEVRHPDLIVLLHTRDGTKYDEHPAVEDAAKMSIPTMAIVDTDCEPNIITYPIPGNDDTIESTQLYLHLFKQAILLGKQHRSREQQQDDDKA